MKKKLIRLSAIILAVLMATALISACKEQVKEPELSAKEQFFNAVKTEVSREQADLNKSSTSDIEFTLSKMESDGMNIIQSPISFSGSLLSDNATSTIYADVMLNAFGDELNVKAYYATDALYLVCEQLLGKPLKISLEESDEDV